MEKKSDPCVIAHNVQKKKKRIGLKIREKTDVTIRTSSLGGKNCRWASWWIYSMIDIVFNNNQITENDILRQIKSLVFFNLHFRAFFPYHTLQ